MNNFSTMRKTLEQALTLVGRLEARHDELLAAKKELAKLPMVDASPYWHADKYLYLIHRTTGGYRPRKYVGNNPDKVSEALAEIERFKEHERLKSELQRIDTRMFESQFNLQIYISKLADIER